MDGATVLSGAQVGTEAELFDIVSRTGSALREKLGLSPVSMEEAGGLAASYSDDSEATRFYSDGLSELRRYRAIEARVLLEKAVENDPSFALAHHALSLAWRTLGYDREAADSARRAFELADGLPREASLMIEARFHENAGNPQEAVASYQLLWAYHQNLDHGLKLAEAQYDADQSSEALQTLEALRRLPAPAGEDPRIDLLEAKARGRVSDYQKQLEAATRATEKSQAQGAAILLAEARFEEGWSLVRLGRPKEGREALETSRRFFAQAANCARTTDALGQLALIHAQAGELDRAESLYREALAISREIGHRRQLARLLFYLGSLVPLKGDLLEAEELLDEALSVARAASDRNSEFWTHSSLAEVLRLQGRVQESIELARSALEIAQRTGERSMQAWTYLHLGQALLVQGELVEAQNSLDQSLAICDEVGYQHLSGYVLKELGVLAWARKDLDRARKLLEELEQDPDGSRLERIVSGNTREA